MVYSPSIGDVVALSKIAWAIAQALSKGRKSAPEELRQVESQLYSLTAAFEAARAVRGSIQRGAVGSTEPYDTTATGQSTAKPDEIFTAILGNCAKTLKQLEAIVKKYGIILEDTDPAQPTLKRWNQFVTQNWKKMEWVTEKGDLGSIRSQIMVHTNSLNLLVGLMTSADANHIRDTTGKTQQMIKDLHEWYTENLKNGRPGPSQGVSEEATNTTATHCASVVDRGPSFELALEARQDVLVVCPSCSIDEGWMEAFSLLSPDISNLNMFTCCCVGSQTRAAPHQLAVQKYGLSHLVFPVREAGDELNWVLTKAADKNSNRLVSLHLRKMSPAGSQRIQEGLFDVLARRHADAMADQGMGNSLCYAASDSEGQRILSSFANLRVAEREVESVTFRSGRRSLLREWIENIQILLYQSSSTAVTDRQPISPRMRPLEYAEVLITYDIKEPGEEADTTSAILKLRRNTVGKLIEDKALVHINSVESEGTYADGRTVTLDDTDVAIQFTSKDAAREFHRKMEDMRMELFIRSLQYPRSDETVAFKLQVARVECETLMIPDAEITITLDTAGKYRLIIVSRNRSTTVSQVLVDDFFASPTSRPNYTGPTYVVQFEDDGRRKVYHYKHGFQQLSLSSTQGNRMLEIARHAITLGAAQSRTTPD
ncbi:hypothetical protein F4780DRAFT_731474 [Xylariomycetidae sp. FL0641]|nr:hypothetical protein F4780DRAFT_731474 [Xylariomycetidae sp. FL0641]